MVNFHFARFNHSVGKLTILAASNYHHQTGIHNKHQSSSWSLALHHTTYHKYLVGGFNHLEKYESVGMMIFPIWWESHSKFHGSSHHQPDIHTKTTFILNLTFPWFRISWHGMSISIASTMVFSSALGPSLSLVMSCPMQIVPTVCPEEANVGVTVTKRVACRFSMSSTRPISKSSMALPRTRSMIPSGKLAYEKWPCFNSSILYKLWLSIVTMWGPRPR